MGKDWPIMSRLAGDRARSLGAARRQHL